MLGRGCGGSDVQYNCQVVRNGEISEQQVLNGDGGCSTDQVQYVSMCMSG